MDNVSDLIIEGLIARDGGRGQRGTARRLTAVTRHPGLARARGVFARTLFRIAEARRHRPDRRCAPGFHLCASFHKSYHWYGGRLCS